MTDTRGRTLLRKFLDGKDGHTQSWLAKLLRIGQPSVSLWMRGLSRPEDHHRRALQQIAGIPAESWQTPDEKKVVSRAEEYATKIAVGAR